ncbi:MAG: AhpC/TSA family protein [Candidatus Symbiothrix sp.]|jgi:peroxiredoxin|nr:AhpC/TSA family protein [Candidatus Symbiothrix sp.]
MKGKYAFYILLFVFIFTSCKNDTFLIEGHISNLTTNKLYLITYQDKIKIDTVYAQEGKFTYESSSDSVVPILIRMEEESVWITAWAKNEDEVKIEGDVNCPELIEIEGNEINNLLTEFKINNKTLIEERCDWVEKKSPDSIIRIGELEKSLKQEAEKFIQAHPASIASLVLIQDYLLSNKNQEQISPYLSMIEGEAKKDRLYLRLNAIVERYRRTAIGSPAPDFSLISEKKDTLSLAAYKDKYVLLTFEASWCSVCEEDYNTLADIRKKFPVSRLEIVTVALDENKDDWNNLAKNKKITWHQVTDTYGFASEMISLYNINTIPNNFLIDKTGIILAKDIPADSLKTLLNEKIKNV